MSRLPPKGHPLYDVIYADRAARQIGALMLLFGAFGLVAWCLEPAFIDLLFVVFVLCLLTVGATFFVLGEILRRRPRLGPAYGLVAVSGTCVGACGLQLAAAPFHLVPHAEQFTCSSVFGFVLTLPVLWHATAALRAMRQSPEQGELGFQVLLPPSLPSADSEPPAIDVHRSDSSR